MWDSYEIDNSFSIEIILFLVSNAGEIWYSCKKLTLKISKLNFQQFSCAWNRFRMLYLIWDLTPLISMSDSRLSMLVNRLQSDSHFQWRRWHSNRRDHHDRKKSRGRIQNIFLCHFISFMNFCFSSSATSTSPKRVRNWSLRDSRATRKNYRGKFFINKIFSSWIGQQQQRTLMWF